MKYATAVYGNSMIRAAEMDVKGKWDNRLSRVAKSRISDHIEIPEEDIVLMDVDYTGSSHYLRHFVAVDHSNKKVVLAIRGTFSLAEVVVDVAGFSSEYPGATWGDNDEYVRLRVFVFSFRNILWWRSAFGNGVHGGASLGSCKSDRA